MLELENLLRLLPQESLKPQGFLMHQPAQLPRVFPMSQDFLNSLTVQMNQ